MSIRIRKLFGNRVRELRLQAGMSQEAFADKVGFDRTYISGIERGKRNPSLDAIEIISKGLGESVSSMFEAS